MKNYKAYLFDLDGTLVDSEKIKGKALVHTCTLFGAEVGVNTYKSVMGKSWDVVTDYFFTMAKIQLDLEEFNLKFKKIYQNLLFRELKPNPNIKEYLQKLLKKKKRLGLVSSASSWMVDQVLTQLKLVDIFEVIITKEDVTDHKPNPEAYLLALEKLGLSGSDVLVFEDSEAGLMAANKANCDIVAFQHEFNKNHDLSLANRSISDYGELLV